MTVVEAAGAAVLARRGADVASAADIDTRSLIKGGEGHGRGVTQGYCDRGFEDRRKYEEE